MSHPLSSLDPSRPVVVVTSQVSIEDVDYDKLPDTAYVFREGSFTDEGQYWFGSDVAAWFVPPRADAWRCVTRAWYRGEYNIGSVLSRWEQPHDLGLPITLQGEPVLALDDWGDLLAQNPAIARVAVSPPDPSIVVVMLGAALALGFTQIILIDGQLSPAYRRVVTPSPLAESPLDHGMRSGSSSARSYELAGIKALCQSFPQARILDGNATRPYAQFLAPLTEKVSTPLRPVAKTRTGGPGLYRVCDPAEDGGRRRCAYVTCFDADGYFWGAVALANSLAKVSSYPLLALVPNSYQHPPLSGLPSNMTIIPGPRIRNPGFTATHQARFEYTFSKLAVFGLSFLDRLVYLDADTLVMRSLDDLFDGNGFAAAPDFGFLLSTDTFNSGVMALDPSSDTFAELIGSIDNLRSADGGDQGFLNSAITDVTWLDPAYNTLWRMLDANPGLTDLSQTRLLHFVGPKPWEPRTRLAVDLTQKWLAELGTEHMSTFVAWRNAREKTPASADGQSPKPQETKPSERTQTKPPAGGEAVTAVSSAMPTRRRRPFWRRWWREPSLTVPRESQE